MPSNNTPNEADLGANALECATRDEESGEETEPSTSGTVIDPEDGLFQAMEELREKLGPEEVHKTSTGEVPAEKVKASNPQRLLTEPTGGG